jgi:hypothetical protein
MRSLGTAVVSTLAVILVGTIGGAAALSQGTSSAGATSRPLVTQAEYERWQTELSNWGRWGKDDELGTLNLITPAKRKQAAALVKDGFTVSLASDAATQKGVDVPCPVEWAMVTASQSGATDHTASEVLCGFCETLSQIFGVHDRNHRERRVHAHEQRFGDDGNLRDVVQVEDEKSRAHAVFSKEIGGFRLEALHRRLQRLGQCAILDGPVSSFDRNRDPEHHAHT